MRNNLLAFLLLAPSVASAVPMHLDHSGRLTDGLGVPLDGSHDITLTLYDAPASGTALFSDTITTNFESGYYHVKLGEDSSNPLETEDVDVDDLFLGIAIDSGPELPGRHLVSSVPYAMLANTATDVDGGVVNATEIQINGTTVIDGGGSFVGTGSDASLSALTCSTGQRAVYDGSDWVCADDILTATTCSSGQVLEHDGSTWNCTTPSPGYTDAEAVAAMGSISPGNALNHDRYTDGEAVSAMGSTGNSNTLNHDRYTDGDAVSAMGSTGNSNALNHDRYTDGEAVSAMGSTGNSNALNHDRYTNGEAVSAVAAADDYVRNDGDALTGGLSVDAITIGDNGASCSSSNEGQLRWNGTTLDVCNGLAWDALAWKSDTRACPSDMVDAGGYCIDRDENSTTNWQAQANLCQQEGKRMCSLAEWIGACNDRSSLGLNNMLDGAFEYVDEYWVMNYTNGNYYASYVSVGANSCGRIYYSGWSCANTSCYDTTHAGDNYESRCCL